MASRTISKPWRWAGAPTRAHGTAQSWRPIVGGIIPGRASKARWPIHRDDYAIAGPADAGSAGSNSNRDIVKPL
ncbi:MAG: hypothetical protein IPK52_20565 [Chloroflexi bacterium]|nr:hypothetical protein [Chloroflexota bacterium]